jgi:hypothetical protein
MACAKTLATVHTDRDTLHWFLPLFFARSEQPQTPELVEERRQLFDSPGRVVVEFEPVTFITYDASKLWQAVAAQRED